MTNKTPELKLPLPESMTPEMADAIREWGRELPPDITLDSLRVFFLQTLIAYEVGADATNHLLRELVHDYNWFVQNNPKESIPFVFDQKAPGFRVMTMGKDGITETDMDADSFFDFMESLFSKKQ